MIENDVRVDLLTHFVDIVDFIVRDYPQQRRHLLGVFQIAAQGVFHAHQMVAPLKQAAAKHNAHKFFAPVRGVGHLSGRGPVQPFGRRHHQGVLPMGNILDDGIFGSDMGMRAGGFGLVDIDGPPGVLVLQPVLGNHAGHQHRVRHKLDGIHQVKIAVRLLPVVDRHGVLTRGHHRKASSHLGCSHDSIFPFKTERTGSPKASRPF